MITVRKNKLKTAKEKIYYCTNDAYKSREDHFQQLPRFIRLPA